MSPPMCSCELHISYGCITFILDYLTKPQIVMCFLVVTNIVLPKKYLLHFLIHLISK